MNPRSGGLDLGSWLFFEFLFARLSCVGGNDGCGGGEEGGGGGEGRGAAFLRDDVVGCHGTQEDPGDGEFGVADEAATAYGG